jgi:hypothetical protein
MGAGAGNPAVPQIKGWLDVQQISPINTAPAGIMPPVFDQKYEASTNFNLIVNQPFIFEKFRMVKTRTYQPWKKVSPVEFYCKHVENTFWHALSLGMYGHEKHWANIKAAVFAFYTTVIAAGANHPRFTPYNDLETAQFVKGANNNGNGFMSTFLQQVSPQFGAGDGVQHHGVSAELWQVVADALDIELNVIIDQPIPGDMLAQRLMISRGNHNSRRIFLFLEFDSEYRAVISADSRNPHNYRFEKMKDVEHNIQPYLPGQGLNWANTIERTDLRKSPFTLLDLWQRAIGVPPLPVVVAGVPVIPAGIAAAYVAPFAASDAIVTDPLRTGASGVQETLTLNTGK